LKLVNNELKLSYDSSQTKIKHTFDLIREVINNKENEILDELKQHHDIKIDEITSQIDSNKTLNTEIDAFSAKMYDLNINDEKEFEDGAGKAKFDILKASA
jgi:hypothetical protein